MVNCFLEPNKAVPTVNHKSLRARNTGHCRTGSVVDVAATSFPVTDQCSGFFLPLVHPSVSVLRFLLSNVPGQPVPTACDHSHGNGTPQQAHVCSRFLHYWTSLCTVMYCPDTRSVFTAPPGAKVSDSVDMWIPVTPPHRNEKAPPRVSTQQSEFTGFGAKYGPHMLSLSSLDSCVKRAKISLSEKSWVSHDQELGSFQRQSDT